MGDRICEDCGLPVVICIAKDMVNEAAKQHGRAAVLSALDAAEARDVGVPELVWERASADAQDVSAKTCFGDYQISVDSAFAGESHYLWVAGQAEDDEPHATFPTMRKAKAAAQAHFAALHPASPLGAVVMREKAARIAEDRNDEIWDIYTGEKVGLDGCAEKIRAIPLPTDDELFAAAAELLAKHFASLSPEELGRFELAVEIDGAIAALAPFTRRGE